MRSYLVELYVPRAASRDAECQRRPRPRRGRRARREGMPIDYVRTTFLPDDETCFHLVEAAASGRRPNCRRAGLGQAGSRRPRETS